MNAIITTNGPYLDFDGEVKTFHKPEHARIFMFLEKIEGEIREIHYLKEKPGSSGTNLKTCTGIFAFTDG